MERIAIFAALRWECQPFVRSLRQAMRASVEGVPVWRGRMGERDVWVVKTGVGVERASSSARRVSRLDRFDLFLSTGCAGALAPHLAPGDLVVATAVTLASTELRFETDVRRREQIRSVADRAGLRADIGPVLCSPAVLSTPAEKRAAFASGAIAVEMEGAPIAACAAEAGIPFVSVRSILDGAATKVDEPGSFVDAQTGRIKPLALARYIAGHPGAAVRLMAMRAMVNAAQKSLDALARAIPNIES